MQKVYIKKDNTIEKKFFIYIKSELNFFVFCNKKIPDFIDPFNLFDYVTELKSFATLNLYNLDCQNIVKDSAVQKNCSNLQYKDSILYFHKNCIKLDETDETFYFKTVFVIKNLDGSKSNYIEKCFGLISYKLIDFDLAKKYIPNKINKVDTRFGTFPEIAPEIYKDSYYTQNTDIWNLGLLALELLQPSKDNLEKEAKAEDIRNGKILSLINNDNLIASFIIVCLKVNPKKRTSPENLKNFLENNNLN
ncbi:Eukaryotic translation initiation factor 2-alpha kinase [Gurleya vavrai]